MHAVSAASLVVLLIFGCTALADEGEGLAERARALVSAWGEAQTQGEAEAYAKLYHRTFSARQGAKKLDRARWLAERRALLGKPLRAEQLQLRVGAKEVWVHLTEVRGAAGREERTRKLLVLALEGKVLRIRGEQVLATLAPAAERLRQAALVLGKRVVLSSEPRDEWASGKPRAEAAPQDHSIRVVHDVTSAKLPAELRAWVGRELQLLGGKGVLCKAKVKRLELVGRVDGLETSSLEDQWANASRLLVGVLVLPKGCSGALLARVASLSSPRVFPAEAPDEKLGSAALAAFRVLPAYAKLQADYRRWRAKHAPGSKAARWDEADGKPKLTVVRGSPALVSVSAGAWVSSDKGGCQDSFRASLFAIWEVTPGGAAPRLSLRSRPSAGVSLRLLAASDLDGDGRLELLFGSFGDLNQPNAAGQHYQLDRGILHVRDGVYDDLEGLELPVLICPC
jgi:hypothetical protein